MNTNQNVVALGVAAANEANQRNVLNQAQGLISLILDERKKITGYEEAKKKNQEELSKVLNNVVTYEDVTGTTLPTTPNANQVTIIQSIAKMNEAAQEKVKGIAKAYTDTITGYDKSIAGVNKNIDELKERLSKLGAEVVTVEQVVG